MLPSTDFTSSYGSRASGFLRLTGFLALVITLAPLQALFLVIKPEQSFLVPQLFHRLLLKLLGFRLRTYGHMVTRAPALFVANHASYLDIPVLGALLPAAFVAKSEVARWPLFGLLAKLQNTVFIERRASRVHDHRNHLQERFNKNQNLVLFPEGTSSDGMKALPFKSSLFSFIEEAANSHIAVQPISITCTELNGLPITRSLRPFYAWYGDMTLPGHLWNVFKFGHFTVDVVFHPPVELANFKDRKALALYCQQQVARGIEQCLTGRDLPKAGHAALPAPTTLVDAEA